MADAAMTESPIAVTSAPGITRWTAAGAGVAADRIRGWDATARVAAPMRSPLTICLSMPDDAGDEWRAPHPALQVAASSAAAAEAKQARAAHPAARVPTKRTPEPGRT